LLTTLWAFPVTRIIDILKIPPARRLEHLPRGWGVLADDLLGSIYAALLLHAASWLWPTLYT
jgi:phosphatidylglycerophosphatase A